MEINENIENESNVILIAVGDISLNTKDNSHPFGRVKETFNDKDILFGNLETVLSNQGEKAEKAVLLYTCPEKVEYLKDAGFDVLNIANNHIMDLGIEGFNETLDVLHRSNLTFIGASNHKFTQRHAIVERKGIRLGFLSYCECGFRNYEQGVFINRIDEDTIVADITALKVHCDIVIVSLHWGIENVFYPSPKQIKLTRGLIDSGAALILGHHSHVVQGIERYKNGLIAYSLGNFQFLTSRERNKQSIILSAEISRNGIEDHRIIPAKIDEDFIPCVMNNEKAREMVSFVEEISLPITEGRVKEGWWFEEIAREHIVGNMKAWIARIKKYGIKHLLRCIRWHMSLFIVKCYIGLLRRWLRKKEI